MEIQLRDARVLRRKTQADMAKVVDKSVDTYRKMEENPDTITIGDAKLLARELQFPIDCIFFGKEVYKM